MSTEEIPFLFKATMAALYGLELPLMLIAAFAFNANLFAFLALWLAGATVLEVAVEMRGLKVLQSSCWGSFFESPLKEKETVTTTVSFIKNSV